MRSMTKSLHLPNLELSTTVRDGKTFVLDPVRRKWVRLTEEEWVRQRLLGYLIARVGVPKGLIAVEKAFLYNRMSRRADIMVFDRNGAPLILVECKAPDVPLTQAVFDQVGRYNVSVGARYILVSNGRLHYCYVPGDGLEETTFISDLPKFDELVAEAGHPFTNNETMTDDYAKETEVAIEAVRQAALLCRTVQRGIEPETLSKKDRSPVTVADFGSQALVCRAVDAAFPSDPVIGEEDAAMLRSDQHGSIRQAVLSHVGALVPGSSEEDVLRWIDRGGSRRQSDRFWTLDPIDGTKGFLRGEQYAVALALIVGGEVEVAVLGCPNLAHPHDETTCGVAFVARRSGGSVATALFEETEDAAVRVSRTRDAAEARFCESVESGHSSHDDAARVAIELGMHRDSIRLDSQAKYAIVASGQADIYMRLPTRAGYVEKIWDHAAGTLVVEEAGGRVTDIHGKPLRFAYGGTLEGNSGVIATNGLLHDQVLDALKSAGVA